ncbi:MAG: shikimate dehydrogenase family protein [Coriobacteriales bacterium]
MGRRYGLVGRTLGHSWSVEIHELLGCGGYALFELEPEQLAPFLARDDLGGCNVTIPYKVDVVPLCDEVSGAVRQIGSVNTLLRREDGTLFGDNTDRAGFVYAARRARLEFSGAKVVVLGSGGTSRTACSAARLLGARQVVVISRHGEDNYDNLERHADADLVVNTTPVGMFPATDAAPVDLAAFPACRGVFDVIYNPRRTRLLAQAERLGIPHTGGLPMLVAQAAASEKVWFDKAFDDATVERIVTELARRHAAD